MADVPLFVPTERQSAFLRACDDYDFVLYGGAAGGGKSHVLRHALIRWLLAWAPYCPGVRVGLFCEDYPALRDRHLARLPFEVPQAVGVFRESTHELLVDGGRGVLAFRNLDDPAKYLSAEFAVIGVDELTRNEEGVFNLLRMRMRWPGVDRPKFWAATNPGGVGHAWVKRLWIDRDFPPELESIKGQFAYVPAKASDNPYLPPGYYDALKTLPPALARAYAEGDWDVFAGQVFQEFRREIHVCKPFRIPEWWPRWLANDPGYTDPSLWYWMAADGDGDVYVYRERKFDRTEPSEQAKQVIAAMTHQVDGRAWAEPVQFCVTGMDAFVRQRETGKSIVDYYEAGGLQGFREPDHGAGCRGRRATIVHEYLRPFEREGKLTARVHIFDTCRELIRTLPTLTADEHDPEAVAECSVDHAFDAFGYGLQAWHAKRAHAPKAPVIRPGTAGDILGHRDILAPKKQDKAFEFAKE